MKWHTEVKKVSELKNWEDNPRTISKEAYEKLKKNIGELGNFEPLVINTDGTVIAGNQRLRLAIEKGQKEIEVSVPERELTEEEIKKIGVISNRHSGEWDMDKLANEFEDVLRDLEFDDLLPDIELEVKEDDYEEPEQLPSKVKLGEIWQLGKHRLMCGDSTMIEDVEKLMNGQRVKCIFTSPPYNMGGNIYKHYSDNKKSEEYIQFNMDVVNGWRVWLDGYLFWNISYNKNSRWEFLEIMYRIAKETGLTFLELIVWDKRTAMPIVSRQQMIRIYEDILVVGDDDNIRNDYEMFGMSTNRSDIFMNKRTGKTLTNYWRIRPSNTQIKGLHEACYPLELPARAIELVTMAGEVIADPFGGSGSTLIACEQLNRICYMMELDPHYCDVVIDRWEKFTGKTANLIVTNE